ncbi:MAG: cupin domain-containing protein [Ferruginibacter sp.]
MQQIQINDHFKVLKVELAAGVIMPRHFATSDAFVIVESGNALLICKGETCELKQGSSFSIPANEPHKLKIIKDFKAYLVLANDAQIKYPIPENPNLN